MVVGLLYEIEDFCAEFFEAGLFGRQQVADVAFQLPDAVDLLVQGNCRKVACHRIDMLSCLHSSSIVDTSPL